MTHHIEEAGAGNALLDEHAALLGQASAALEGIHQMLSGCSHDHALKAGPMLALLQPVADQLSQALATLEVLLDPGPP